MSLLVESLLERGAAEGEGIPDQTASDLPPFTFDDIYSSSFSYSSFYPNWVSASEYLYRDSEGIKKFDLETNTSVIVADNEFYQNTGGSSWSLSQDEQFLLVRTAYIKQWRYSYNGSYAVYQISE
ncbi:unnamed protein product [Clavelina lepadiformis]|uniref:Uncharacterized protein n=1 Tax=Clavelina lepadiformis TaxID=159417 RepID=A0ABP0F4C1_CLALP